MRTQPRPQDLLGCMRTQTKMAKGERCIQNEDNSPDLDQYAKDALDELFSKEEQTYEEFLQGFMFLKKDDVKGYKANSFPSEARNGALCQDKKTDKAVVKSPLLPESCLTENDSIPEEVLGPGTSTTSILTRTAESACGSVLQVDNFVDFEDETSDDDIKEEETQSLDDLLDDEFVSSSTYSPSVPLNPSASFESKEVMDSRLQSKNLKADLDDKNVVENSEICYLSGASNLPGEVEEQELTEQDSSSEVGIKPNLRQLHISTRINKGDDKNDNVNTTIVQADENMDEVQPFTLDSDFDYDNVALTPKFSFVPKHMS